MNYMKTKFLENKIIRGILEMVAVVIGGIILLNLTFLLDYVFQNILLLILKSFFDVESLYKNAFWFPSLMHVLFVFLMGVITYYIFKSKWKTLFKAIYLSVPTAVTLVSLGIFLYQKPIVVLTLSVGLVLLVLFFFYKKKLPWIYFVSIIWISITLLVMNILGKDI